MCYKPLAGHGRPRKDGLVPSQQFYTLQKQQREGLRGYASV